MVNRQRYSIEDRPQFKDGDMVEIDMAQLGNTDLKILKGKVVGVGVRHVIDYWLIEFEQDFGPTYPFRVANIPHVAILKP